MSSESFGSLLSNYGELIGLSALVSGGVSALVNYFINFYDFKKKAKIESLKEKIELYSYVIFQLDRMRFMAEAMKKTKGISQDIAEGGERYLYREKEGQQILENITKAMEKKYHLLSQEILSKWMEVYALFSHPIALESTPKLRKMLIDEYNNQIINEYQKLTGIELERKN
jgi:hypothetical protein